MMTYVYGTARELITILKWLRKIYISAEKSKCTSLSSILLLNSTPYSSSRGEYAPHGGMENVVLAL